MISSNQHLTRQLDLIPIQILKTPINIIGAGAVGSFTALSLAKMGFSNITVYDNDIIDVENMNCQFFRFKDINTAKVDALESLIFDFTNVKINKIKNKWQGEVLDGIVISAVDNMSTRKAIFETHFAQISQCKLIIDPRMSAEMSMMLSYSPFKTKDCEAYIKTLYSDQDAVQERCTAKSTIYCVLGLSSMVCTAVKNFLVDNTYKTQILFDLKTSDMVSSA